MRPSTEDRSLERIREEIDAIDRSVVGLFATRIDLAREAHALKREAGLPASDPAREARIVKQVATEAREFGIDPERVREIFWRVLGLSQWARSETTGTVADE